MIIASVPHSGSRFVQKLLGCKFLHVYSGESLDEIKRHDTIVVPLRHPLAVAKSWKRRGKPITEHPKHECMVRMFRNLIDQVDPLNPKYLPVDNARRTSALIALEFHLGMVLKTDWAPVTDDIDFPDTPLTLDDELAVHGLLADPFFERNGY